MTEFSRQANRRWSYLVAAFFLCLAGVAIVGVKAAEFAERRGWVKREVPAKV